MNITIHRPLGYSQIGRKDQQEDAVWPLFDDVTADERIIVLCDGVGGSEHGEVASQTVSRAVYEALASILREKDSLAEEDAHVAVEKAYDALDAVDTHDGQVSMATTLTCIAFHSNGVMAMHMGDSRIYHIRPGVGVQYQSTDHSLVNALIQAGELTIEEAMDFPRKNVITKALQPNSKRIKAEVHQLVDVKSGDYFFLCCDGVLEQLTNRRLVEILSMHVPDDEKIQLLEAESTDCTRDNYTAYLIPVKDVEGVSCVAHEDQIHVETFVEVECDSDSEQQVRLAPKTSESQPPSHTRQKMGDIMKKVPSLLLFWRGRKK